MVRDILLMVTRSRGTLYIHLQIKSKLLYTTTGTPTLVRVKDNQLPYSALTSEYIHVACMVFDNISNGNETINNRQRFMLSTIIEYTTIAEN